MQSTKQDGIKASYHSKGMADPVTLCCAVASMNSNEVKLGSESEHGRIHGFLLRRTEHTDMSAKISIILANSVRLTDPVIIC